MVNGDGRVNYAWYLGNFDSIKPKKLTYEGRLFMLDTFKGPNQIISGGGGTGPPLTQESQYSQISEFEYEEENENIENKMKVWKNQTFILCAAHVETPRLTRGSIHMSVLLEVSIKVIFAGIVQWQRRCQ